MTAPSSQAPAGSDADLDAAVEVLRLLADRTRLAVPDLLHDGELSVGAIAEVLDR